MAMPSDFWRNEQMLNIFRTKPCQRLSRDGVCGWRSQCQFSHCAEWPRRQPRRCAYSPEVCPNIKVIKDADGGVERLENNCSEGLRCKFSHSKEEVCFHPQIFKTSLCEEYTNNSGANSKTRNSKKNQNRCHRYYCPFAHGNDELRTSPLSTEQREKCLRGMEVFESDTCCVVCTRHWIIPPVSGKALAPPGLDPGASLDLDVQVSPALWPQKAPQMPIGHNAFDGALPNMLGRMPYPMQGEPAACMDIFAARRMMLAREQIKQDPSLYKAWSPSPSLFESELLTRPFPDLSNDSPAFIDLASGGYPTSQRHQPLKLQESTVSRDEADKFYYAML